MRQRDMGLSVEIRLIRRWVERYRRQRGITPTPGRKPEPSCIGCGEGQNLLYCQLVSTVYPIRDEDWNEYHNGWAELRDARVRDLAADTILLNEEDNLKKLVTTNREILRLWHYWAKRECKTESPSRSVRWRLLKLLLVEKKKA